MRLLFVCLGNICRSPTAEAVFRDLAAASGLPVTIDSCGTADWHRGKPPYGPSIEAAAARGYDLTTLRARPLTRDDFARFDLILAMDAANLRDIEAMRPEGSATPVMLFMDNAPETGVTEVPDPYHTRDFDQALDLIEAASRGLIARIAAQPAQ
jgi:protein-tyrosine phosphatase